MWILEIPGWIKYTPGFFIYIFIILKIIQKNYSKFIDIISSTLYTFRSGREACEFLGSRNFDVESSANCARSRQHIDRSRIVPLQVHLSRTQTKSKHNLTDLSFTPKLIKKSLTDLHLGVFFFFDRQLRNSSVTEFPRWFLIIIWPLPKLIPTLKAIS